MVLTDKCTYNPDPNEHETRCAICGKLLQYEHVMIDDNGAEITVGVECVKKLNKEEKITKWPRRGSYFWTLKELREQAHWNWKCANWQ